MPTCTSTMSFTPFFWQFSNSLFFMRRDALVMSGVSAPTPLQNCSMPPPVPVDSRTGDLREASALANASDAALAKGNTVEEPTMRIS